MKVARLTNWFYFVFEQFKMANKIDFEIENIFFDLAIKLKYFSPENSS